MNFEFNFDCCFSHNLFLRFKCDYFFSDLPCREAGDDQYCYAMTAFKFNWTLTRGECQFMLGDISVSKDEDTQTFLDENGQRFAANNIEEAWIGAQKTGGAWNWVDGDSLYR